MSANFYGDMTLTYGASNPGELILTIDAPYEEGIFTDQSGTPVGDNVLPYALETKVTFGGGAYDTGCAYPQGEDVTWNVNYDSADCEDQYTVAMNFQTVARGSCGWDNADVDFPRKYSKTVTVSRRYQLTDANDGTPQYRTESTSKVLSVM